MRILVVEDDPSVAQILKILLTSHNYAVETAADGEMGLSLAEAFEYDLILLDILLPKLDGITLCKRLRAAGYQMPILLLTGQGGSYEKVVGLDTGADDYVVKPFDQEELIARVRALLRRGQLNSQPILEWGNLQLDPGSREVTYSAHPLALTPKEYGLLEMFLRNPRLTFSLGMILEHLWTFEEAPGEDAVRVHIKTLRQKLKAVGAPIDLIETVYGVGYRLNPLLHPAKPDLSALREPQDEPQNEPQNKPQIVSEPISEPISEPTPAGETAKPTVLIVEPNAQVRPMLKTLLESQGLRVMLFDDFHSLQAQDFSEMLSEVSPNLLLLSVEMPWMGGLKCCQMLRQDDRWRTLPILLILPQADIDLVRRVFAAGASDFVSLPIVGPELLARIWIHLEKAQLQQKVAALEAHTSSEVGQQGFLPLEDDRLRISALPEVLESS